MPEGLGPQEMLAFWRASQEAFWTAAGKSTTSCVPSDFGEQEWLVFDHWAESLLAASSDDESQVWLDAAKAIDSWRAVVAETLKRISVAFDVQRRALAGSGAELDWRILRDRWFAIAEAEFIQTLRSEPLLAAQRDCLRAGVRLWHELSPATRDVVREQRRAGATLRQTMASLGADLVPIATTAKDLVWRDGKVTLWRYRPMGRRNEALPPLLLCHGLIGRQTMTDLRPERSMVRQLLVSGADVFAIDWGDADAGDRDNGLDHYVGQMIPAAVEAACHASAVGKLVLFGICQGGTLAACHATRDPSRLAGLITAVAPFDFNAFTDDADPAHGILNLWIRSIPAEDFEALIDMDDNLSGDFIGLIFQQLNPVRTLAKYAVGMVDAGSDPHALTGFLAMENWLMDRPDLPGRLAKEWLLKLCQQNQLAERRLEICGESVDLGTLQLPVLNIYATADHITPAPSSQALARLAPRAQITPLALPTGHIGTFVSERSQPLLAPSIMSWLSRDAFTTP